MDKTGGLRFDLTTLEVIGRILCVGAVSNVHDCCWP